MPSASRSPSSHRAASGEPKKVIIDLTLDSDSDDKTLVPPQRGAARRQRAASPPHHAPAARRRRMNTSESSWEVCAPREPPSSSGSTDRSLMTTNGAAGNQRSDSELLMLRNETPPNSLAFSLVALATRRRRQETLPSFPVTRLSDNPVYEPISLSLQRPVAQSRNREHSVSQDASPSPTITSPSTGRLAREFSLPPANPFLGGDDAVAAAANAAAPDPQPRIIPSVPMSTMSCPICWEEGEFDAAEHALTFTHCGHCFGFRCLKDWFSREHPLPYPPFLGRPPNSCPICRARVFHDSSKVREGWIVLQAAVSAGGRLEEGCNAHGNGGGGGGRTVPVKRMPEFLNEYCVPEFIRQIFPWS